MPRLEHEPRKIAINPDKFDKLITALRTEVDNEGTLDNEASNTKEKKRRKKNGN